MLGVCVHMMYLYMHIVSVNIVCAAAFHRIRLQNLVLSSLLGSRLLQQQWVIMGVFHCFWIMGQTLTVQVCQE
jgi:hypothetical protein